MKWLRDLVVGLTGTQQTAAAASIPDDVMVTVASGVLDINMMDELARHCNARQGVPIRSIGNLFLDVPYDRLKGLSSRVYFVAPDLAEEFQAKASIAENAGQPLDREIVAVSLEVDKTLINSAEKIFGASALQIKPSEAGFRNSALYSLPKGEVKNFKEYIARGGQSSLDLTVA